MPLSGWSLGIGGEVETVEGERLKVTDGEGGCELVGTLELESHGGSREGESAGTSV